MPRALITGGAGFIGSHTADLLLSAGYEVDVLDDLSTGKREFIPSQVRFFELDVRSPEAAACVRDGRYDVVAHLAAQIDVRKSVKDPRFDVNINIGGTLNVLETVRAIKGTRPRVVFVSTGGALYGDAAGVSNDETTAKNPDAPYGIAKLGAEQYAAYYGRVHGIEIPVLRLGNVYGPRQDPHGEAGVVSIFIGRILEQQPVTVFGDGEQVRDYVYVGDVAASILAAATKPLPPAGKLDARAFNIGTGVGTSVLNIARNLTRIAGRDPGIEHAPRRTGELQVSVLDVQKAETMLGWTAKMELAEGLKKTYEYFSA